MTDRRILLNLLTIALVLIPAISNAQSPFEGASGTVGRDNLELFGGVPEDFAVTTSTLFIAMGGANGLFCSTDQGDSWNSAPAGNDFGSVIAVVGGEDSETAYFIGGIRLYKTSDSCETFEELTFSDDSPSDFNQSLAFAHETLLVAFRDGSITRSTDNGATLTSVIVGAGVTEVSSIAASPTSDVFYALVTNNNDKDVFRSTDGGASWSDLGSGLSCNGCTEIAVNPSDANEIYASGNDVVYRSADGGSSWTDVSPAGLAKSGITFDGNRTYVGSQYTEDSGSTWSDFNDDVTSSTKLTNLFRKDPSDATVRYMISARGFAKSTDSGSSFTDSVEGLLGVTVTSITQSTDKQTVYIAAPAGVAKTENFLDANGPTWEYPLQVDSNGDSVQSVFISDTDNPDTVFASTPSGLFRSTNGGDSWQEQTITSDNYGMRDGVVEFVAASNGTLYAAHVNSDDPTGGVIVSTDDGSTWTDSGVPGNPPINALVAIGNTVIAGAGTEMDDSDSIRGIFRLSSGTWTHLSGDFDGELISDIAANGDTVYAVSGDGSSQGVFKSEDAGLTWTKLSHEKLTNDAWYRAVAVNTSNADNVFVASGRPAANGVILESKVGGETWSTYYDTLVDEVPSTLFFDDLLLGSSTGLSGFSAYKCKAKLKKGKLKVRFIGNNGVLTDPSTQGIVNLKAIVKTSGLKLAKPMNSGKTLFKNLPDGKYKARCKYKVSNNKFTVSAPKKITVD
ncbi:MAG: hypothetical protein KDD53_03390 [Bdellovibrionales bacterium]|nr:hypothetical protein [Bdellovibrionales bacterium]